MLVSTIIYLLTRILISIAIFEFDSRIVHVLVNKIKLCLLIHSREAFNFRTEKDEDMKNFESYVN